MQGNRKENSRFRDYKVFLSFEEIEKLKSLGVPNNPYTFQELLELLPKKLDISVPDDSSLRSFYIESDRITPGVWRHDLEVSFLITGELRIGYRWSYFDCSSPLYPFSEEIPEEGYDYSVGGITSKDWLGAVYQLLVNLLESGLCKFS